MTIKEAYPFDIDVCSDCEKVFRRPTPQMVGGLAIKPALRVVYRVELGGKTRSFLSRKAAYQRYARKKMAAKWPCNGECAEDYMGEVTRGRCNRAHFDGDHEAETKLWKRYVRWLIWHDKVTRKLGNSPFA